MTVLVILAGCHLNLNKSASIDRSSVITDPFGAIVRMDTTKPYIYLIFSGHDFNEGREKVLKSLTDRKIKASFFFTGDFYRNTENKRFVKSLIRDNHYLGAHSDRHLLYADWTHRDSTLVSRDSFVSDLKANYHIMKKHGNSRQKASVFLPPYEWYNRDIYRWAREMRFTLINFTPGTGTARDYTWPEMGKRYTPSQTIIEDLMSYEEQHTLNGAIILIHLGTDPQRKDKLYNHLPELIDTLTGKGYVFKAIDN